MNHLSVFAQGHTDEQLESIEDAPHIVKINLNTLPIGKFQDNRLAEYRLFLSDLPSTTDSEYLGFGTWQWNKKWYPIIPIQHLNAVTMKKDVVYYVMYANEYWMRLSSAWHPGIDKYVYEIARKKRMDINKPTFWATNFICHRSVYEQWELFFREVFNYLYNKYGMEYNFPTDKDDHRKPALLCERMNMLFFANQPQLKLVQLPLVQTSSTLIPNKTVWWCEQAINHYPKLS